MPDDVTTAGILNGNLGNILNFLSAAAGLGTAAMGSVDSTKAFWGGPSNFGFGCIKNAVGPFLVRGPRASTGFGEAEILRTLRANWLNGVAQADEKAKARALIHLGLTERNADSLARRGRGCGKLTALARKVANGTYNKFKGGMRPSDFFHRNVVLSFQEDAIGIRLRDVIGVDNLMWGSDYPHSESTFPQSRKILAEILAGVPEDEQAKIVSGHTARVYRFDVARLTPR